MCVCVPVCWFIFFHHPQHHDGVQKMVETHLSMLTLWKQKETEFTSNTPHTASERDIKHFTWHSRVLSLAISRPPSVYHPIYSTHSTVSIPNGKYIFIHGNYLTKGGDDGEDDEDRKKRWIDGGNLCAIISSFAIIFIYPSICRRCMYTDPDDTVSNVICRMELLLR